MPEVNFRLQKITPLFLAGNDQREIEIPPEYRQDRKQPDLPEVKYSWEYAAELRPRHFLAWCAIGSVRRFENERYS